MSGGKGQKQVLIVDRNVADDVDANTLGITNKAAHVIIQDSAGDMADVITTNGYKGLVAVAPGHISTDNSTAEVLDPDDTFVGEWEDVTNFGVIVLTIHASHGSITDGLVVEFSSNGSDVDSSDEFTIPVNKGKTFSFQAATQYYRVSFINVSTLQTHFRLQTILKPYYVKPSSHRIADSISDQDDAELITNVNKAKKDDGTFINIGATDSGNLKVANVEDGLSIARGDVSGTSFIHKFGAAPDFDVADGFVTVWDGAEDATVWEKMLYTYSATDDIDSLSSEDNGDTQDIEIQGLDANFNLATQTITLTGQTPVALSTNLIRVFRLKNVNSTDNAGHIFCYVSGGAVTLGVPQVAADIRAIMQPLNNQTLMAVYTIPNGKTGYMRDWYASTAGAKRDSQHSIELRARNTGEVFQLKHLSNIAVTGTSYIQHNYTEPEVFAAKTDIEMRMDTDTDIAGVSAGFDIVLVDN